MQIKIKIIRKSYHDPISKFVKILFFFIKRSNWLCTKLQSNCTMSLRGLFGWEIVNFKSILIIDEVSGTVSGSMNRICFFIPPMGKFFSILRKHSLRSGSSSIFNSSAVEINNFQRQSKVSLRSSLTFPKNDWMNLEIICY